MLVYFKIVPEGHNNCQLSIVNCQFGEAAKQQFIFSPRTEKTPAAFGSGGFLQKGLERREVEKRIYLSGKEAAHGFRNLSVYKIPSGFEHPITDLKTKFDQFVNKIQ